MKKSRLLTLASSLVGPCALLLTVVLPGCETSPPTARYLGGSTEYISTADSRRDTRTTDDAPSPTHHRTPAPERVAAQPSPARTPGASATPSASKPGKVQAEVQDPSELKADDTTHQKKTGSDKSSTPAKVDAEIRNPSDLH